MRATIIEAYRFAVTISPEHQVFAEACFADRSLAELPRAQHRIPMSAGNFHVEVPQGKGSISNSWQSFSTPPVSTEASGKFFRISCLRGSLWEIMTTGTFVLFEPENATVVMAYCGLFYLSQTRQIVWHKDLGA
jgi:hypothetical protein